MPNATHRTRVLLLSKGLGPGGMERLLVNHARTRDRVDFEYSLAYVVDIDNPVVGEIEAEGIRCERLGTGRSLDLVWTKDLRDLVRRERIDIVHMHSPQVAGFARPALRTMATRPKIIYTEHSSWASHRPSTRFLNAATMWMNDDQVAVSEEVVASIPKRLRRGIQPLIHGVDLEGIRARVNAAAGVRASLGIRESDIVITTVANLRRQKAYEVLLEAAAIVVADTDHVRFLSVGEGPLETELLDHHRRLGLRDRFCFLGYRDDVVELLGASDVFAMSSSFEGLPVALMEAMAIGLPVVATAVGGIPSVVEHSKTGVLVPPRDPGALAEAILDLCRSPSERQRLGTASREQSGMFDAVEVTRSIESRYREVVSAVDLAPSLRTER